MNFVSECTIDNECIRNFEMQLDWYSDSVLYVRSSEGRVLLQSPKKLFSSYSAETFFPSRFRPLGLRNCNKKISCLSVVRQLLSVCLLYVVCPAYNVYVR